ncbi:hypothetical protein VE01_08047 [Pseudogymnoascus verrucosus]|uniref:Uncharacterized protein n=1 Tax=Pseudogymnoascus verrucosus TaxID=342668 RepID=A0A1B8GCR9_9PEZI|nr:uncharacterized protein VE01_08047 [Pseudogymnoascus verrucosus]OBT93639.1 hypothetical protein VE01_08047 [Pseudogymnoascus verrucosus]
MRTRSSGPAKDPITGEIFPDPLQSTIPAFIHKPVPFNPFPESAFPTLEFPIPPERHERARRIARGNRGRLMTPRRSGSPSSVANSQPGLQGVSPLAQGITPSQGLTRSMSPQLDEIASILRNQPLFTGCTSHDKPGAFDNNPYWEDGNELHPLVPTTMEKKYAVIPAWSDLTPGVQIMAMSEMVLSFGLKNAPKFLELEPEEINRFVDLQEREVQAQAAEEERAKQYLNQSFQEMLAGKLDGSNTMELLDLQFSNGSIWEPATFAMKRVDLKAGSRFLRSLGFEDESIRLWQYHGMDVSIKYESDDSNSAATNDPQGDSSPKIERHTSQPGNEITVQPDEPENLGVEAEPSRHFVPKATRNLLLDKVMRPKKSRPPKRKQVSFGLEPYSPARTPSKLRMSISVDEIQTDEASDEDEEASPVKARVARQVPTGTDLSKAVKYTRPTRQWADLPNTGRGSKEQHIRKQRQITSPLKQTSYVDLTELEPDSPVTPEKQKYQNDAYLQAPSENVWFAPVRGRSRMPVAREMMSEPLREADYPSLPVVKNVAGFANPLLAAKWAKFPKPNDNPKFDEPTKVPPVLRRRSALGFGAIGSDSPPGKESLPGSSVQYMDETPRSKRKTMTSDELPSPFDASTPDRGSNGRKWKEGTVVRTRQLSMQEQYVADEVVPSTPRRANNGQKWKEGTVVRTRQLSMQEKDVADEDVPSTPRPANNGQKWKQGTVVRTRQLSIQEQYIADEDVPIEMLDAGEQILMTRPRIAARGTRKSSGLATTGEGRNGRGEGTRKNSGLATNEEGGNGKGEGTRKNSGLATIGEGRNGKGDGTRKNSGVATTTGEGRNGRGEVTRGRPERRFYVPRHLMDDPDPEDEDEDE